MLFKNIDTKSFPQVDKIGIPKGGA